MPSYIAGEPAEVESNLPAAKNISSSTNATPIVITTSTAHGLLPGDVVIIAGAADAAANGLRLVGLTPSSTSFHVLTYPAGANVAGTTPGGAAGTVQNLGFGVTLPIPSDATDDMDAVSVNVAFEALADRTAHLQYAKQKRFNARVALTAGDHTVTLGDGERFQLAAFGSGGPYVITLENCAIEGARQHFFTPRNFAPSGLAWTIQRSDGTDIATFVAKPSTDLMAVGAEVEVVGGVWRLGLNTGWDTSALMGVHPEAGA